MAQACVCLPFTLLSLPPSFIYLIYPTCTQKYTQMVSLLQAIRNRNAHILPRALGPELARFQRMKPETFSLSHEDEAAIAVNCLDSFWPQWPEREGILQLARSLPPPLPPAKVPSVMFDFGDGKEVSRVYWAPGTRRFSGFTLGKRDRKL